MFLGMVYHVRRRQQAQAVAEALAAERERDVERKSVFLSDASHELLTPITIGRGHLELLQRDRHAGPGDVSETCDVVLGELGRMERVINRLLLLESADATAPKAFERIDPVEVVTEVFQRWRGTAEREWILGDLPHATIAGDRDQLTLALDALVENAVQHTRTGQRIEIGATAAAGTIRIRVRDGGHGIPDAAQPRVFDRFYRVDGARSRETGGVGLGLAIVKAIAAAHGGSVMVRSRVGQGSTFELCLPGLRSARDEPVAAAADGLDHGLGFEFAP
jgi:signal transduction histidine kinase